MNARGRLLGTLGLLLPALLACSVLPEPPAAPALHDFGPHAANARDFPWARVEVAAPDWLQDALIHYRFLYARPTEVRAYTRDRWLAPPAVLLAQRLTGGSRDGSYRLDIELQDFEQIFDRPGVSRVVLAFRATVTAPKGAGPAAEQAFLFEQPAPTADAAGALAAYPRLIQRAGTALRDWIARMPQP
jgi:cholesterol transport system auxiliary component